MTSYHFLLYLLACTFGLSPLLFCGQEEAKLQRQAEEVALDSKMDQIKRDEAKLVEEKIEEEKREKERVEDQIVRRKLEDRKQEERRLESKRQRTLL